jgi:hypothetical protein
MAAIVLGTHMMADYCWDIMRECPEETHSKKSRKRSFLQGQ